MAELKSPPTPQSPIGLFDSGVGGISILREIHALLPHEHLIYIADSANAPYGEKSLAFIKKRSLQLSHYLISQNAKALVVACNTATVAAISYLRQQLSIPIIGVEPAIKPAASMSQNGRIGVLATSRTIKSRRLKELVSLYANDKNITLQACPGFVELVESCKHHDILEHDLVRTYTRPLLENNVDTIVLGCTHYPFLLPHIRAVVGEDKLLLETGKPVALQIQRILTHNSMLNPDLETGSILFYSSQDVEQHAKTISKLWGVETETKILPIISVKR